MGILVLGPADCSPPHKHAPVLPSACIWHSSPDPVPQSLRPSSPIVLYTSPPAWPGPGTRVGAASSPPHLQIPSHAVSQFILQGSVSLELKSECLPGPRGLRISEPDTEPSRASAWPCILVCPSWTSTVPVVFYFLSPLCFMSSPDMTRSPSHCNRNCTRGLPGGSLPAPHPGQSCPGATLRK